MLIPDVVTFCNVSIARRHSRGRKAGRRRTIGVYAWR